MNPGSACLWVRVPCIVTFQGKMFGISSAKSAGQLGVSPVDLEFRFVGAPRIGGTPYVDDFVITGISRAAAVVSLEARSTKSW